MIVSGNTTVDETRNLCRSDLPCFLFTHCNPTVYFDPNKRYIPLNNDASKHATEYILIYNIVL